MSEPWSIVSQSETDPRAAPRIVDHDLGIEVVDPIEQCREVLWIDPASVTPREAEGDAIPAPVSTVARLPDVEELRLSRMVTFLVRTPDWETVSCFDEPGTETHTGEFVIDIFAPMKLYLQCEGRLTLRATGSESWLDLSEAENVLLGARSLHSRPSETIQVEDRPEAIMRAFSTFGNALKTTTPDRSWPNLRGHPPLVSVGATTRIPEELSAPASSVQIAVPREYEAIFPVAPLAYYLGAEVVPGMPPRIETDQGFEYRLVGADDDPTDYRALEDRVNRTLRQVLFLEALARKHGLMHVSLHEREALAGDLPIDLANFYDLDPASRLTVALAAVDYDSIAEYVPEWPASAYLAPSVEQAELVPYLVHDLSLIRTKETDPVSVTELSPEHRRGVDRGGPLHRSTDEETGPGSRAADGTATREYVQLTDRDADVLDTVWGGQAVPIGASKLVPEAFRNRIEREPSTPPIDVAVVCNDAEMANELEVADYYRDAERLPLDVSIYRTLSTSGLRTRLEAQQADFLHYIGHADERGLRCSDGHLDVGTLDGVETDVFLLNACQSYGQGLRFVEQGAIAGVVTLEDIPNVLAADIGSLLARLLGTGYQLRAALAIIDEHRIRSNSYLAVGDSSAAVAESSVATLYRIDRVDDDTFELEVRAYASNMGIGGAATSHLEHPDLNYCLIGNSISPVEVSEERLSTALDRVETPVKIARESGIRWSSEIDLGTI